MKHFLRDHSPPKLPSIFKSFSWVLFGGKDNPWYFARQLLSTWTKVKFTLVQNEKYFQFQNIINCQKKLYTKINLITWSTELWNSPVIKSRSKIILVWELISARFWNIPNEGLPADPTISRQIYVDCWYI